MQINRNGGNPKNNYFARPTRKNQESFTTILVCNKLSPYGTSTPIEKRFTGFISGTVFPIFAHILQL